MLEIVKLSAQEAEDLIHLRMPEAEVITLLKQLTPDHITVDVLHQLIQAIQKTAIALPEVAQDIMDCCGTGGSGQSIFNTSTASAFVLAAGGVPMVKFGNRALSSTSGSFDFLEHLGIGSKIEPERLPDMLSDCGLVFLYAPQCYPALAPFNQLRKKVGIRTVFNFIGPLLHPLNPAYRLLGVSNTTMQHLMADYLKEHQTQSKRAFLVHHPISDSLGLDEISPHGTTHVLDLHSTRLKKTHFQFPEQSTPLPNALSPQESVQVFQSLIAGELRNSIYYHLVSVNSGAGFVISGKAGSLEGGIQQAQDLLKNGKVLETVQQCRRSYERYCR